MSLGSYGSLCFEGPDQVGKGDASSRILSGLEDDGISVTSCSFPIYSTPIGSAIRMLLKEGYPEDVLSSKDTLSLRMALFALNRLEFLDVYLEDKKYRDSLLVLDRSPYSNAVTIGYGLSLFENWDNGLVKGYINEALTYDSLIISKLGLNRCVIQLKSEESRWRNIRSIESDQYEKEGVQERCSGVYEMYKEIVGRGWHQVITKSDDGWKDRDEIREEIGDILWEEYGPMLDIRGGERFNIGFKEIVGKMYPKSEYNSEEYLAYENALRMNEKDQMYSNGVSIGKQVASSCLNIKFSNSEVREEFKRILSAVPEVMGVFGYFLGNSYVNKLKRALEL